MFLVLVRGVLCRGLWVRLLLVLVVNTVPHSTSSLETSLFGTWHHLPMVFVYFCRGASKVVAFTQCLFSLASCSIVDSQ